MVVVHALPGRRETLLRPGLMLPYDKGALAHVHAHAHAHALAPPSSNSPFPYPFSLFSSHILSPP